MNLHYSSEKNIQILIALLKAYNIKNFIASPGSANANFVISVQSDPFFHMYSCIDERSAGYMACGMAAETQEPVVVCCTGATASRNYMPALTEAFYRKLPVIAITATRDINLIGMGRDQVVDRTVIPNDISVCSVHLPIVNNRDEEWECMVKVNKALSELNRNGGGPVHINLTTSYSKDFSITELPPVNVIKRHFAMDNQLPKLSGNHIAIFVGAHGYWRQELTDAVDTFCEKYNAVVLCDQNSNYHGKYGVFFDLLTIQTGYHSSFENIGILIQIGEISSSGPTSCKQVWRVSPDGEIRDTYKKLTDVFEMDELSFFEKYNSLSDKNNITYYKQWKTDYDEILNFVKTKNNELPFSSIWVALNTYNKLPENSVLHLAILNSLRSWNYFGPLNNKGSFANTGGFGIDGPLSTVVGASLANPDTIYYCVVGDLAFFYDMNALGNRHIGNNLRIILINNGLGSEFKNNLNPQQQAGLGEDANPYVAAQGHYGCMSHELVKHYAEDLGFNYKGINNKKEYLDAETELVSSEKANKPLLYELFVNEKDDVDALKMIENMKTSPEGAAKQLAKNILGDKGVSKLKRLMGK